MKRTLEPELMDDQAQALAYAKADFAEPNASFLEHWRQRFEGAGFEGSVLDIGCGPADIAFKIVAEHQECQIFGVDGSQAMLDAAIARKHRGEPGAERLHFMTLTLPAGVIGAGHYDAILSNSLLHHLHQPGVHWQCVRDNARPGTRVLVMDLLRPDSQAQVEALVQTYAAAEPEVLRRDFSNSLCAAFTLDEVVAQLVEAQLGHFHVERVSDRHMLVWGEF